MTSTPAARSGKRLRLWVLAIGLAVPFACAAQENECGGPNGERILRSAYPSASPIADRDHAVDGGTVTLPTVGSIGGNPHAVVCRRWPADPRYLLVAVPILRYVGDVEARGDLDILVMDRDDLRVQARLRLPDFIEEDAIALSRIAFDTAPYRLVSGRVAFGLRASVQGSSRANPFHQTTLWLFDLDGGALRPILADMVVERSVGEWDTNCAGAFRTIRRTLALGNRAHSGATDIVVRTRDERTLAAERNGACEETTAGSTATTDRLRFDGRAYRVPKAMKGD